MAEFVTQGYTLILLFLSFYTQRAAYYMENVCNCLTLTLVLL